ncbi:MAG: cytochrome c [Candidatus Hydrothermarchaeales archaeon]
MKLIKISLTIVALLLVVTTTPVWASDFEESVNLGREIYAEKCAVCHGASGEGGVGPALNSKSKLESLGMESIHKSIVEGILGTAMPPWEADLSPEEIDSTVTFIFAEWAGMVSIGIEMWPWEVAFVIFGGIWSILGFYYIVRP